MAYLHGVLVLHGLLLRRAVTWVEVGLDTDVLEHLLGLGEHLFRARLWDGFIEGHGQALAVLFANAIFSWAPAGLIEQALGFFWIEGIVRGLILIADSRLGQDRCALGVGIRKEGVQDIIAVNGVDDGLAHALVFQEWMAEVEVEAIIHATGGRGENLQVLILQVLLIGGFDLARDIGLAGYKRAHAHGVFGREHDIDALNIGRTLVVLAGRRRPVIILALLEHQLGAQLFFLNDEGTRTGNRGGIARREAGVIQIQGGIRKQSLVHYGGGLREAWGRLAEVELYRVVVDDLGLFIIGQLLRWSEHAVLVTQGIKVIVLLHVRGIQAGAIRVGHALANLEGEFGVVLVRLRHFLRNPRVQLEGIRVLPEQAVRDVIEHTTVGVIAAGGRIEVVEHIGLDIGDHAIFRGVGSRGARGKRES